MQQNIVNMCSISPQRIRQAKKRTIEQSDGTSQNGSNQKSSKETTPKKGFNNSIKSGIYNAWLIIKVYENVKTYANVYVTPNNRICDPNSFNCKIG